MANLERPFWRRDQGKFSIHPVFGPVVKRPFTLPLFSCPPSPLQHEPPRAVSEIRTRLVIFSLAAQICGAAAYAQEALPPGSFKAYAAEGVEARVSDFSGMPVPRYS